MLAQELFILYRTSLGEWSSLHCDNHQGIQLMIKHLQMWTNMICNYALDKLLCSTPVPYLNWVGPQHAVRVHCLGKVDPDYLA